ncbi:hypothetical protein R3P38DRAFT_3351797 [Favolaschia claudopus]|uniref:Helicase C-terminal domain-containing protein n=1 Tax=Favolaschia claudopus TaxID=2862362 RepID=A0AAW0C627_9AGAR
MLSGVPDTTWTRAPYAVAPPTLRNYCTGQRPEVLPRHHRSPVDVVIFVQSVARANELDKLLVSCNFPSISIHSGLAQEERVYWLPLISSVADIDVERVNIVMNHYCPPDADSYLHRVGHAGRFGTKGLAVTFVASETDQQVMATIQSPFTVAVPELPDHIDRADATAS